MKKQKKILVGFNWNFVLLTMVLMYVSSPAVSSYFQSRASTIDAIIENVNEAVERARLETKNQRKRMEELEVSLKEAREEAEKYKRKAQPVESLVKENINLREQLADTRTRLRRKSNQLTNIQEQTGLAEKKERLQHELDITIAARRRMKKSMEELRREHRKLNQSLKTATLERKIAQRQMNNYRKQLSLLQSEYEKTRQNLQSEKSPETSLSRETSTRSDEEIKELRSVNSSLQREIDSLRRNLQQVQAANADKQKTAESLRTELAKRESRLNELKQTKESLIRRNKIQERLLQLQESSVTQLEQAALDRKTEQIHEDLSAAEKENKLEDDSKEKVIKEEKDIEETVKNEEIEIEKDKEEEPETEDKQEINRIFSF